MKIPIKITLLIIFITLTSCDKTFNTGGYKYNHGSLPKIPINLSDFNTEYDDYNSTAPSLGELIPFCFSTNRISHGNNFNIIYQPMNVNFDKSTGNLKVTNEYANWQSTSAIYNVIKTGLKKIKTEGNEFGPNLLVENISDEYNFTLLYSTDITGNSDINFTRNSTSLTFSEPKSVQFLNSDFDDMYPTFNTDKSKIYFCSNRNDTSFNFYYTDVNSEIGTVAILSDNSTHQIVLDSTLSSNLDDKCPFIFENKMVFTSNREGGFGGYDLYYSTYENGSWSEPINFGEDINTEFDEFRPILIDEGVSHTQTMMVFSSNRTGGLGGFDLYFVGITND